MSEKALPFTKADLQPLLETHPTPFYVYDEAAMCDNISRIQKAFSWAEGFKNYFAVKATPNPFLLKLFREKGLGADCSSYAELMLSEQVGLVGEDIMFTSNDTPAKDYEYAKQLGAIINLDDISHIAYVDEHVGLPELVCCRYNPGALRKGNAIIGTPEDAKYGFTRAQLFDGYRELKKRGVTRFGLHTMVASNELNPAYFVDTAKMLFELVGELSSELGISFEFVNMGGGIGIPYRPGEKPVDYNAVSDGVRQAYEELIVAPGLAPLRIVMECGRVITGPYGFLVSTALHKKSIYKEYVGLDSCMANLMRPGMYDAYHHISVLGKESAPATCTYDVTGSLCENNDKFAIDRELPEIEIGDVVVIHDAGAHGHSMGFNYNGKLRSAEFLRRANGTYQQIRRAETLEDHFATLDFSQLQTFDVAQA